MPQVQLGAFANINIAKRFECGLYNPHYFKPWLPSFKHKMESKRKKKEALKQFGKRLSQLRKERGLSFRKLATQCDVDYSDIKKIENGEKNITLLTVIELSIGLDIHPKELMNFDTEFLL